MLNILGCTMGSIDMSSSTYAIIPAISRTIIAVIQFGVPVLLIIFGSIDMGKAVISNDEEEMKKSRGKLIKRIIYALAVLLVVQIVKIVFGVLADVTTDTGTSVDNTGINSCISCFLSDETAC